MPSSTLERPTSTSGRSQLEDLLLQLPRNFEVKVGEGKMVILEDWFQWQYALLLLTFAGAGALAYVQNDELIRAVRSADQTGLCVIGGIVVLLLALFYWVVAGLVNTTRITVQDKTLSRTIGPLPWFGEFSLPTSEIHQLFAVQKTRKERKSMEDYVTRDDSDEDNPFSLFEKYKKVSFYKLVVRTRDGKRTYNVSNEYRSTFVPHTLECVLEALLGIQDCYVPGEVRRQRS